VVVVVVVIPVFLIRRQRPCAGKHIRCLKLAMLGATIPEIARYVGVGETTVKRRARG
jgi:hypothetical protein